MFTASIRRKTVLLLLSVVLASPWALKAEPNGENPRSERIFDLANLYSLDRLWSFLMRDWAKEGCDIDPNGRCNPQGPAQQTKEGCGIDPNGRPLCKP